MKKYIAILMLFSMIPTTVFADDYSQVTSSQIPENSSTNDNVTHESTTSGDTTSGDTTSSDETNKQNQTSNDSANDEESTKPTNQPNPDSVPTMRQAITTYTDNVYVVNTADELVAALEKGKTLASNETLNIKLNNDISYPDSTSFKIYSNVVINGLNDATGEKFKMLRSGTSTISGTAGFTLTANGYNVTYEDLSFGDSTYSTVQTYYGILLGTSYQTNFTMRNVDYYGQNGAQPLCNYNKDTIFRFEGTNNFTSRAGTNAQEFIEGRNIVFGSGSKTNIQHNTGTAIDRFIYNSTSGGSSGTTITLEDNAYVNIDTDKRYVIYISPLTYNIGKNATFIYNANSYGVNFGYDTPSTYNIDTNATLKLSGYGKFSSIGTQVATFNVTDPSEVSFENTSGSGLFTRTSTMIPKTTTDYLFDSTIEGTTTTKDAPKTSISLMDSTFGTGVNKVVYYPKALVTYDATSSVVDAVADTPVESDINISNIAVNLPYTYITSEYKLYTSPIVDETTINTDDSQNKITNDTSFTGIGNIMSTTQTISNVKAGTYTLYLRANTENPSGKNVSTPWVAKTITVRKTTMNVTIPVEMTFTTLDNSEFTSKDQYEIQNNTNYGTKFGIESVTNVNGVTLVGDKNDTTSTNPLYLALKNTEGKEIPFIETGTKSNFDMTPFGGITKLNLVGKYSGPISMTNEQKISYTLTTKITN